MDQILSQSLIHQVSVSEAVSEALFQNKKEEESLNPLFIRSQFQSLFTIFLFLGRIITVSIPYSSGLSFRGF